MKIDKRRRRESKTDYATRIGLLKGNKPRLVFRKTNRYIIAQYVISKEAHDSIQIGLTSKLLLKYGWPKENSGSLKSIPASYLTGYLMGRKIAKEKLKEPIVDLGMIRTTHKTKVFSFLKGVFDSGIKIKCDKKAFPEEDRISGKNIKSKIDLKAIKLKIDAI